MNLLTNIHDLVLSHYSFYYPGRPSVLEQARLDLLYTPTLSLSFSLIKHYSNKETSFTRKIIQPLSSSILAQLFVVTKTFAYIHKYTHTHHSYSIARSRFAVESVVCCMGAKSLMRGLANSHLLGGVGHGPLRIQTKTRVDDRDVVESQASPA